VCVCVRVCVCVCVRACMNVCVGGVRVCAVAIRSVFVVIYVPMSSINI